MLNRRHLFGAAPAVVALAIPALSHAAVASRKDLIQHHAEALVHLLREELPEDTDRVQVFVSLDEGTTYIGAEPMKKTWVPEPRAEHGGYWREHSMGRWSPQHGIRLWQGLN